MSLKLKTNSTTSIPTTIESSKKKIEELITKGEGIKKQINILETNKSEILKEKEKIEQKNSESPTSDSLEEKKQQIENIDRELKKYNLFFKKILKEIDDTVSSLKNDRKFYKLPSVPNDSMKSKAKGIKKSKRKKSKRKKTKRKKQKKETKKRNKKR